MSAFGSFNSMKKNANLEHLKKTFFKKYESIKKQVVKPNFTFKQVIVAIGAGIVTLGMVSALVLVSSNQDVRQQANTTDNLYGTDLVCCQLPGSAGNVFSSNVERSICQLEGTVMPDAACSSKDKKDTSTVKPSVSPTPSPENLSLAKSTDTYNQPCSNNDSCNDGQFCLTTPYGKYCRYNSEAAEGKVSGGICGDNVCDSLETQLSCPQDCDPRKAGVGGQQPEGCGTFSKGDTTCVGTNIYSCQESNGAIRWVDTGNKCEVSSKQIGDQCSSTAECKSGLVCSAGRCKELLNASVGDSYQACRERYGLGYSAAVAACNNSGSGRTWSDAICDCVGSSTPEGQQVARVTVRQAEQQLEQQVDQQSGTTGFCATYFSVQNGCRVSQMSQLDCDLSGGQYADDYQSALSSCISSNNYFDGYCVGDNGIGDGQASCVFQEKNEYAPNSLCSSAGNLSTHLQTLSEVKQFCSDFERNQSENKYCVSFSEGACYRNLLTSIIEETNCSNTGSLVVTESLLDTACAAGELDAVYCAVPNSRTAIRSGEPLCNVSASDSRACQLAGGFTANGNPDAALSTCQTTVQSDIDSEIILSDESCFVRNQDITGQSNCSRLPNVSTADCQQRGGIVALSSNDDICQALNTGEDYGSCVSKSRNANDDGFECNFKASNVLASNCQGSNLYFGLTKDQAMAACKSNLELTQPDSYQGYCIQRNNGSCSIDDRAYSGNCVGEFTFDQDEAYRLCSPNNDQNRGWCGSLHSAVEGDKAECQYTRTTQSECLGNYSDDFNRVVAQCELNERFNFGSNQENQTGAGSGQPNILVTAIDTTIDVVANTVNAVQSAVDWVLSFFEDTEECTYYASVTRDGNGQITQVGDLVTETLTKAECNSKRSEGTAVEDAEAAIIDPVTVTIQSEQEPPTYSNDSLVFTEEMTPQQIEDSSEQLGMETDSMILVAGLGRTGGVDCIVSNTINITNYNGNFTSSQDICLVVENRDGSVAAGVFSIPEGGPDYGVYLPQSTTGFETNINTRDFDQAVDWCIVPGTEFVRYCDNNNLLRTQSCEDSGDNICDVP